LQVNEVAEVQGLLSESLKACLGDDGPCGLPGKICRQTYVTAPS
jgi:hypothetical protein